MRPLRWRRSVVLSEAVRNTLASPGRAVLLTAIWAVCTFAVAFADVDQAHTALKAERDLVAEGRDVLVVDASGGVDAGTCWELATQEGVLAAGAARQAGQVALANVPRMLVTRVEATAGAVTVWDPDLRWRGRDGWLLPASRAHAAAGSFFLAGEGLAQELGLATGMLVGVSPPRGASHTPASPVLAIIDASRRPDVSRSLISVVPPIGTFDECWVEFHPAARSTARALLDARVAGTGASARPFLDERPGSLDPTTAFTRRTTRHAWVATALILALLWALLVRQRRAEFVLYRTLGFRTGDLALLSTAELALPAVAGTVVGTTWALALFTFLEPASASGPGEASVAADLAFRNDPALAAGIARAVEASAAAPLWLAAGASLSVLLLVLVTAPLAAITGQRGDALEHLRDR